jgi:hypothetical protein
MFQVFSAFLSKALRNTPHNLTVFKTLLHVKDIMLANPSTFIGPCLDFIEKQENMLGGQKDPVLPRFQAEPVLSSMLKYSTAAQIQAQYSTIKVNNIDGNSFYRSVLFCHLEQLIEKQPAKLIELYNSTVTELARAGENVQPSSYICFFEFLSDLHTLIKRGQMENAMTLAREMILNGSGNSGIILELFKILLLHKAVALSKSTNRNQKSTSQPLKDANDTLWESVPAMLSTTLRIFSAKGGSFIEDRTIFSKIEGGKESQTEIVLFYSHETRTYSILKRNLASKKEVQAETPKKQCIPIEPIKTERTATLTNEVPTAQLHLNDLISIASPLCVLTLTLAASAIKKTPFKRDTAGSKSPCPQRCLGGSSQRQLVEAATMQRRTSLGLETHFTRHESLSHTKVASAFYQPNGCAVHQGIEVHVKNKVKGLAEKFSRADTLLYEAEKLDASDSHSAAAALYEYLIEGSKKDHPLAQMILPLCQDMTPASSSTDFSLTTPPKGKAQENGIGSQITTPRRLPEELGGVGQQPVRAAPITFSTMTKNPLHTPESTKFHSPPSALSSDKLSPTQQPANEPRFAIPQRLQYNPRNVLSSNELMNRVENGANLMNQQACRQRASPFDRRFDTLQPHFLQYTYY